MLAISLLERFGLFEIEWDWRRREEWGKSGKKTEPKLDGGREEKEEERSKRRRPFDRAKSLCPVTTCSMLPERSPDPGDATMFLAKRRHCWPVIHVQYKAIYAFPHTGTHSLANIFKVDWLYLSLWRLVKQAWTCAKAKISGLECECDT